MPESGSLGSVRGASGNGRPLYVAACSVSNDISSISKESGEPHASLWSKSLCGRYGPAFPSSAVCMPDGIQGRGVPLIPRTRWPDAEPCRVHPLKW